MTLHQSHTDPSAQPQSLRKFGLITGAVIALLFGALLPWLHLHALPLWPWIAAAMLWACAVTFPRALRPIYQGWMKLGAVLGFINTRIILGLFQLFGRDPMHRRFDGGMTYRVPSKGHPPKHMEKPF
jgi:hypothetical protein